MLTQQFYIPPLELKGNSCKSKLRSFFKGKISFIFCKRPPLNAAPDFVCGHDTTAASQLTLCHCVMWILKRETSPFDSSPTLDTQNQDGSQWLPVFGLHWLRFEPTTFPASERSNELLPVVGCVSASGLVSGLLSVLVLHQLKVLPISISRLWAYVISSRLTSSTSVCPV